MRPARKQNNVSTSAVTFYVLRFTIQRFNDLMQMRAMTVTAFGGPEVLRLQEMPIPVPGEHDLLIEVHCAALNPVDFKIRRGAFRDGRKLPFIPGYDVSGVVRGLGTSARGFTIGDEVY